ncbi:MAG: hypothetical protein IT425_05730 [Pirellulales bacterium]|nr:hypothetical protein [Pirellulales bacterium]
MREEVDTKGRCGGWQRFVEVLLIVAVFFVVVGDPPPNVNESHYLGRVKHYWNPAWCAGDQFLESQDTQLAFIWVIGPLTKCLSLTATAWIGRAVAWVLIAWGWQGLSWRFIPHKWAAVLSASLFLGLTNYCHLAGEWVVGGVEAKCFAYALVLFALRAMIDDCWNAVWLWFGAATAVHPLVGGWCAILSAGVWGVVNLREGIRVAATRALSMSPGLLGGAAMSLIGILPALSLGWNVPAEVVAEANQIYVFDRLPHHLAPLTLVSSELTRRLAGHLAIVVAMLLLSLVLRKVGSSSLRDELIRLRRLELFACGAVGLAIIGFAIEYLFQANPAEAARWLRYYWFRTTDIAAAMAVALQVTVALALAVQARKRWAVAALGVTIAVVLWYPITLCQARWESRGFLIPQTEMYLADVESWRDVCEWIANNTPPDAVFITPRQNQTFKWRAGRAEVATRKDIPQDASAIVEWKKRLTDVYGTTFAGQEIFVDSVGTLGMERVTESARKYGAQFVLSDRTEMLRLPVVYQNREYLVYRIDD